MILTTLRGAIPDVTPPLLRFMSYRFRVEMLCSPLDYAPLQTFRRRTIGEPPTNVRRRANHPTHAQHYQRSRDTTCKLMHFSPHTQDEMTSVLADVRISAPRASTDFSLALGESL
jgi:hypothetical protein